MVVYKIDIVVRCSRFDPDALLPSAGPMLCICRNAHSLAFPAFGRAKATKPLGLGLTTQPHTSIVEPFDGAILVIACNHLIERDLIAIAVSGLGWVERHLARIGTYDGRCC